MYKLSSQSTSLYYRKTTSTLNHFIKEVVALKEIGKFLVVLILNYFFIDEIVNLIGNLFIYKKEKMP